jgi:hypothetical protein
MRHPVRHWLTAIALATVASHAWAVDGPLTPAETQAWEGLRARLALSTNSSARDGLGDLEPQRISSLSLMGDYYLSRPWLGTSGGLRATSGVLFGSRGSLWSSPAGLDRRMATPVVPGEGSDSVATQPYLGVGYTGWSKGGFGLSADLGLMASPRGNGRLGKGAGGNQSLDDSVRDLRFAPLVQLGLSYSF